MTKVSITNPIFFYYLFFTIYLSFLVSCDNDNGWIDKPELKEEEQGNVVAYDGAWCWFSDPRAIYYSENEIITGWVKTDGSVEVAKFNFQANMKQLNSIYPKMQRDDHNNPAFTVLPDGNIFTMYAWHGGKKGVISNTTSNGANIFTFEGNKIFKPKTQELLDAFPNETYTYANPYILKGENNKLFAFGRWIGFKPNVIISEDNGKSWSNQYVIVNREPFQSDNRPYAKYFSDGDTKIHMVFTDGHPRNEHLNSVYYCYYENGTFWRADGSMICDLSELPMEPKDASVVYRPDINSGRAWICDIVEKDGTSFILYTRHPQETDHRYHYAWYNSVTNKWEDNEICKAGKWFPQTQPAKIEREPHYMGNMTFNPGKPEEIFLSREVNGVFEIEKFITKDGGISWDIFPVTENSVYDNVRPYVPRYQPENARTIVLWMENKKYIHYTDYDVNIKYFIDE